MAKPETRAWWDDVQHLRDSIERKREKEARRSLRLDARSAARAVAERAAGEATVAVMDPDPPSMHAADELAPRRGRRFERAAPERRGRFARTDRDGRQRDAHTDEHREPARPHDRADAPDPVAARPHNRADAPDPVAARRHDRADAPEQVAARPLAPPPRRRTVEITGRTVGAPTLPRLVEIDRRRPARRAVERVGARPDRLALWAVVLGFFLIFVAVTSTSHAATRAAARPAAARTAAHHIFHAHTAALRASPPAR